MCESPILHTAPSTRKRRVLPGSVPLPCPRRALATALLLTFARQGYAATLFASCEPGDSALLCRMRSVLTLLDLAAGFLGLVLLLAILVAVRAYRRKPRKLAPEDLTTDVK